MKKITRGLVLTIVLMISACVSDQMQTDTSGAQIRSAYAGNYRGTETFESGTFPLKIYIKESGKIAIIDVDNLSAKGQLEGNKFKVKRYGSSPMVFEGSINDSTISGVTYGNRFLGDGTFTVKLKP